VRLAVAGGAAAVLTLLLVAVRPLWRIACLDYSPFDDGPFKPVSTTYPQGRANSSVECDGLRFECYNQPGQAPVIATMGLDGQQIGAWALTLKDVRGARPGTVERCELSRVVRRREGFVAHGVARWTYGDEHATFYFDGDGKLRELYLSW